MFDYLNYKNKIPLNKCVIEIPKKLNPAEAEYTRFWIHKMFRKVVEGNWVEHNGEHKWIPGPLILYTSLWNIKMKVKGVKSAGKSLGRPRLRDLEWIKGYIHATARGFSGFDKDEKYSCHRFLIDKNPDDLELLEPFQIDSFTKNNGDYKIYKPALEYLYEYQTVDLGKPLYYNEAKNVVDIEARDMGKSMISGCFCGHNFLTDGITDFDEWLKDYYDKPEDERRVFSSNTLVSAISSFYSGQVIEKIKDGLNNIPGSMTIAGIYYPAPLTKMTTGSWEPSKNRTAQYEIKEGGKMKIKGSGSTIMHRSFGDNEFSANGSRYSFGLVDEVGLMGNLLLTLGQLHDCTTVDRQKYGTIWMTGTGGDMEGGATEAVKKVFYDPAAYDCLEFDDLFENTGKKIGLFIPSSMAYEFRDEFGNVDKAKGQAQVDKKLALKRKAKDQQALTSFLQMHPTVPSEAFLITSGNDFPVADLLQQLKLVEASDDDIVLGTPGRMVIDSSGKVSFEPELGKRNLVLDYPIKKGENNGGILVVWEHPDPTPGYGYYVAGNDPYNQDKAPNSESVGSLFVMKRKGLISSPYDMIVAEYTARPDRADQFYEECRRILLWYNGICLYENNFNGLKTHFQYKNSLNLLAFAPGSLKANKEGLNNTIYGIRMSGTSTDGLKSELLIYLRDWLTEKVDGEKMNLHFIYSKGLLKELIAYVDGGNFDRVIALMLAVAQSIQMRRIVIDTKKEIKRDPFFERAKTGQFFTNRR